MRRRKHPNDRVQRGCYQVWCYAHAGTHHRGMWSGVKEWRKIKERAARARARDDLKQGREPEPYRTRGSAKWNLW